jgi:large subunit ribosomal protein L21
MYAIVDIAGQQMESSENGKLFVNRLKGESRSEIEFNKVLLIENDGKVIVGNPVL